MSLPVRFGVEGRRVSWSQTPRLMALEKWKCGLGEENLETCLSVQSQVLEGRSWEGEKKDSGAGALQRSLCPVMRSCSQRRCNLPGRASVQDVQAFGV